MSPSPLSCLAHSEAAAVGMRPDASSALAAELELDPVCVLTLANSINAKRASGLKPFGPALNLAQKAAERGLRHHAVKQRA
jgi:hypothetical protein